MKFKCVPVRPGQLVFVTLKTIPNYCKATWTQRHLVPGISVVFISSLYITLIHSVVTHDMNNINSYCPFLFYCQNAVMKVSEMKLQSASVSFIVMSQH